MEEKEKQSRMIQGYVLQENLRSIEAREEMLIRYLEELHQTKESINELKGAKASDALISMGSTNFVKGKITDTNSVIVNIGGGAAIRKSREEAIEILENRIKEGEKALEQMERQKQIIISNLNKLQSSIESQ